MWRMVPNWLYPPNSMIWSGDYFCVAMLDMKLFFCSNHLAIHFLSCLLRCIFLFLEWGECLAGWILRIVLQPRCWSRPHSPSCSWQVQDTLAVKLFFSFRWSVFLVGMMSNADLLLYSNPEISDVDRVPYPEDKTLDKIMAQKRSIFISLFLSSTFPVWWLEHSITDLMYCGLYIEESILLWSCTKKSVFKQLKWGSKWIYNGFKISKAYIWTSLNSSVITGPITLTWDCGLWLGVSWSFFVAFS